MCGHRQKEPWWFSRPECLCPVRSTLSGKPRTKIVFLDLIWGITTGAYSLARTMGLCFEERKRIDSFSAASDSSLGRPELTTSHRYPSIQLKWKRKKVCRASSMKGIIWSWKDKSKPKVHFLELERPKNKQNLRVESVLKKYARLRGHSAVIEHIQIAVIHFVLFELQMEGCFFLSFLIDCFRFVLFFRVSNTATLPPTDYKWISTRMQFSRNNDSPEGRRTVVTFCVPPMIQASNWTLTATY